MLSKEECAKDKGWRQGYWHSLCFYTISLFSASHFATSALATHSKQMLAISPAGNHSCVYIGQDLFAVFLRAVLNEVRGCFKEAIINSA